MKGIIREVCVEVIFSYALKNRGTGHQDGDLTVMAPYTRGTTISGIINVYVTVKLVRYVLLE